MGRHHCAVQYHLLPGVAGNRREASRQDYSQNPDPKRENSRLYRAQNPEACRRYRKQNLEAIRKNDRSRYWQDPERSRARARQSIAANLDAARERWRRRKALRRSARRRALVELTLATRRARFALWADRCAYCGSTGPLTVDHVLALTAGGLDEPSNIAPACSRCNCSKNATPVEQWFRRQPFFAEARWRKLQQHAGPACAGQLPLVAA